MTHIDLGVSLGLGLQLLLGGSLQTTDSRGEETAGDHGSHCVGSDWLLSNLANFWYEVGFAAKSLPE